MIRILIIDDLKVPEFDEQLRQEIQKIFNTEVHLELVNPATFFNGGDLSKEKDSLLAKIHSLAAETWDVALIDINLHDEAVPDLEKLELPFDIEEAFREENKAAIVMIYSSTLADFIPEIIAQDKDTKKRGVEQVLRRIFKCNISAFISRNDVVGEVVFALGRPPLLLEFDRFFVKYAHLKVEPQEAEFKGRTFLDLAKALRRQDKAGLKIAQLITEHGFSCFVELNS